MVPSGWRKNIFAGWQASPGASPFRFLTSNMRGKCSDTELQRPGRQSCIAHAGCRNTVRRAGAVARGPGRHNRTGGCRGQFLPLRSPNSLAQLARPRCIAKRSQLPDLILDIRHFRSLSADNIIKSAVEFRDFALVNTFIPSISGN